MLKLALVSAVSLAIAAPAAAQIVFDDSSPPAPAPSKAVSAKTDVNKVICEEQEEIGSRLNRHRVCMTQQQWKEYQAENREKTDRLQGSAGVRPSG